MMTHLLSAPTSSGSALKEPKSEAKKFGGSGLFHLIWNNIPIVDEQAFLKEFREHSLKFAYVAAWGSAIVGTISALWRQFHNLEGVPLLFMLSLNWAPVVVFGLFPAWSRAQYQWLLDFVWGCFFLVITLRLATNADAAIAANIALLIADTNKSLLLMIVFPVIFARLPFKHACVLAGSGTFIVVAYAAWRFGFGPCFQLMLTPALTLILSLVANWGIEARDRILFKEQHKLRKVSMERDQLLRALYHDANNTLFQMGTHLLALRQLADSRPDFGSLKPALMQLRAGVDELNGMTSGMYDLVRLGQYEPSLGPIAVADILSDLGRKFAETAAAKGLSFGVQLPQTPMYVMSDRAALQNRILDNLISNAIKYTKVGSIEISTKIVGEFLRFEVADTGPGIPADKHQDIFNEFVRNTHAHETAPGLGLGLACVKLLCKKLSHTKGIHSEIGVGSRFWVDVPIAEAPTTVNKALTVADLPIERRYVLVVDDDSGMRKAIAVHLRNAGYKLQDNVQFAASVAEVHAVIERLPDRPPTVVICDFRLESGETGNDVVGFLDAHFSWYRTKIPVVFLSAEIKPPISERPHTYFLKKTGNTEELLPALEAAISTSREELAKHDIEVDEDPVDLPVISGASAAG